jgi:hypothetical protein
VKFHFEMKFNSLSKEDMIAHKKGPRADTEKVLTTTKSGGTKILMEVSGRIIDFTKRRRRGVSA